MLKIAVASSDGIVIDQHFGQARRFLVYEVEEGGTFRAVGERQLDDPPVTDRKGHHSTEATAKALADLDAVLVARIGPGGAETLKAHGVRAFAVGGSIERALSAYGRRHRLLDVKIPGVSQCFTPSGGKEPCGCSKGCK